MCWAPQDPEICSEVLTHKGGLKGDAMPESSFHFLKIEGRQRLFLRPAYFLERQPMISLGVGLQPKLWWPCFMLL